MEDRNNDSGRFFNAVITGVFFAVISLMLIVCYYYNLYCFSYCNGTGDTDSSDDEPKNRIKPEKQNDTDTGTSTLTYHTKANLIPEPQKPKKHVLKGVLPDIDKMPVHEFDLDLVKAELT